MQKLAKVLLVDDDSTATFLHSNLLNRLGVAEQLLVARNGAEALQVLDQMCRDSDKAAGPMLVLLDVQMPIMGGAEFLEAYQQHPVAQKCHVVIVVLTTSVHSRDLERIQDSSVAADVLTKPLTREKVETILHRHFQQPQPAL